MDDKSFTIRVPRRWLRVASIVGVTALIVAPLTAYAIHDFTDVPDSNTFHEDISAIADAGVTLGCNPPDNDEYCPDDNVTREQMAAFMNRLGALGPGKTPVANAATALQADNATTAGDADTVDGQHAADLINGAALVNSAGTNVSLAAGATTEVLSLELAPGTYVLSTTGILNNNAGTSQSVECEFSAGGASIDTSSPIILGPNVQTGDRESITLHLLAELDATSAASLSCTTSGGWSGNVIRPQILAVTVQSAVATTAGAADSGEDDG